MLACALASPALGDVDDVEVGSVSILAGKVPADMSSKKDLNLPHSECGQAGLSLLGSVSYSDMFPCEKRLAEGILRNRERGLPSRSMLCWDDGLASRVLALPRTEFALRRILLINPIPLLVPVVLLPRAGLLSRVLLLR